MKVPQKTCYDLHTHSKLSDGSLSPASLIALAEKQGVTHLSITDHDTLNAYAQLASDTFQLTLIPGIELSTQWQGRCIHIVGLNVDPASTSMQTAVESQKNAREKRAELIAHRLKKAGIDAALEGARKHAGNAMIGRPHFARYLVEAGIVPSWEKAFKKYLGAGKPGDIKQEWPQLDCVTNWILDAGGIAVIAHPLKYSMTRTWLIKLIDEFNQLGGQAIEVCSGAQDKNSTQSIAALCNKYRLLASTGSDFHHPGQHWSLPGSQNTLPPDCTPVWAIWQQ